MGSFLVDKNNEKYEKQGYNFLKIRNVGVWLVDKKYIIFVTESFICIKME